jgi:hypothetical protein
MMKARGVEGKLHALLTSVAFILGKDPWIFTGQETEWRS